MDRIKIIFPLFLAVLFGTPLHVHAEEIVLRTALQDSPPKAMRQGASVSGICLDIIHELNLRLARDGIRIDFLDQDLRFLPWKRSQQYLAQGKLDLVVGMAKSNARKKLYVFSRLPLYQVRSILMVRADSPVVKGGLADLDGQYVIAVRGTKTARMLTANPGIHVSLAPTPLAALEMLLANRGDCVFYHDLGLLYLVKTHHWQKRLRPGPVIERYSHYVAYSRKLSPAIRDAIDHALATMRQDGTLEKIVANYR